MQERAHEDQRSKKHAVTFMCGTRTIHRDGPAWESSPFLLLTAAFFFLAHVCTLNRTTNGNRIVLHPVLLVYH